MSMHSQLLVCFTVVISYIVLSAQLVLQILSMSFTCDILLFILSLV